jgi:hypothetical protein
MVKLDVAVEGVDAGVVSPGARPEEPALEVHSVAEPSPGAVCTRRPHRNEHHQGYQAVQGAAGPSASSAGSGTPSARWSSMATLGSKYQAAPSKCGH